MVQHDDPPVATFRVLYTLLSWGGLIATSLILVWLVWTLFTTTSTGTARSQELAIVRPTVTAMAETYAVVGEGGVVKVDLPSTCAACHRIEGTSADGTLGPELTHVGSQAADRLSDTDYTGKASTVEDYIRESILEPNAYVVPGEGYGKPGASTMPAAVGNALSKRDLDRLVAYLATLE